MNLYFAAAESALPELSNAGVKNILISMANGAREIPKVPQYFSDYKLIIDSGAFTFAKKNVEHNDWICREPRLEKWIKQAKKLTQGLVNYELISLDVIGHAEYTKENYDFITEHIPDVVPTFHVGSEIYYLKKYADKTNRICIGGMVPYKSEIEKLKGELLKIFKLFSKESMPKFHAFGYFSQEILDNFPWHSADASTWQNYSRFGEFHGFDKFIYKRFKSVHVEKINYNSLTIDELYTYMHNTPELKLKAINHAINKYQNYLTELWTHRLQLK